MIRVRQAGYGQWVRLGYPGLTARCTTSGTPRATGITSVRTRRNPAFRKVPSNSGEGCADHTARTPPGLNALAQLASPDAPYSPALPSVTVQSGPLSMSRHRASNVSEISLT